MKDFLEYFLLFMILSAFSSKMFAQVTETRGAAAAATIIDHGSMSKTINTDFGNVSIILSAFVKMAPVNPNSTKGGIVLPVSSGTFTAAIYDFTGTEGLTYSVSYPTNPIIIKTGQNEMQVGSFESMPARNPASKLIAGVFVSITPSNVTVNYN